MARSTLLAFSVAVGLSAPASAQVKVLIVDGQNNHAWKETTPVLRKLLEETGLFQVTSLSGYQPPVMLRCSLNEPSIREVEVQASAWSGRPSGRGHW